MLKKKNPIEGREGNQMFDNSIIPRVWTKKSEMIYFVKTFILAQNSFNFRSVLTGKTQKNQLFSLNFCLLYIYFKFSLYYNCFGLFGREELQK